MSNIWPVARHTFSQCLRTKVAAVFTVILVAVLALLPSTMEGDGTLAGRVRTFLDYSTTALAVLLSLVVIFLSVSVVSTDVTDKHVFLVCTKPLARWQYILGRWLGVVLLATMLLAGAATAVYLLAGYLRGRTDLAVGPEDRRAVETEIFTARTEVLPAPPDVEKALAERVAQKKADGSWAAAVESYKINYKLDEQQAASKLADTMTKELLAAAQSAAANHSLSWSFQGIRVAGEPLDGGGRVTAVRPDAGLVTADADGAVVSRLIIFGPVWINGVGGRVVGLWSRGFRAVFHMEAMRSSRLADVKSGDGITVRAEPTVQISYKVSPADPAAPGTLRAAWQIENPATGFVHYEPPRDIPVNSPVTLIAPARCVDETGRLRARYLNLAPASVMVLSSDVAVLYPVGGFTLNFLKTAGLLLAGLMFLAALGIFAGSFVSFPVGCLVCFGSLPFSVAGRFIGEAIQAGLTYGGVGPDPVLHFGHYVLTAMQVVLPDLISTMGTTFLVDGLIVPWRYVGVAAALTVALRGTLLLALACWIFHRRELARVQV